MAIPDNLSKIYEKFAGERLQESLFDRYPGSWRAVVVETNDPLNMHRVRFMMPEMHDFNLQAQNCPWAVANFAHGNKGAGEWTSPCIGDIIWITFEKQHPYGPIWTGHAEPTRRRYYKLHATYQQPQVYVDPTGNPQDLDPLPWITAYGPKDGRPYSQGMRDRYGNILVINMNGFYPSEHSIAPAPVGVDALTAAAYQAEMAAPSANNPDTKMMSMISKYGHYFIIGDQGYNWQADFTGNFETDYANEKIRQNNLHILLNENQPVSNDTYDQRRVELRTSYGHKFEMRDVGWGQTAPSPSLSRANDFWPVANTISEFPTRDERWVKLRSKSGHLMQFMDMGNLPGQDTFCQRLRIDEVGGDVDQETVAWQGRDARQMRFVTRYGFKFVLDDRGTDPIMADQLEAPHGNGALIKGRRKATYVDWIPPGGTEQEPGRILTPPTIGYTPKHGDQTTEMGYGIEFDEKNNLNRLLIYSPKAAAIEINDRLDYVMMATSMDKTISAPWQYLQENEFATIIMMAAQPELDTYNFKLDRANTYVALGTPLQQTFEARDGWIPSAEAFVEVRDMDDRGMVLSKSLQLSALHDPTIQKYLVLNDLTMTILLHNKQGDIQIYSAGDITVKSDSNIFMQAAEAFTIECAAFGINAGGTTFGVGGGGFGSNGDLFCVQSFANHIGCAPGENAGPPSPFPAGGAVPVVTLPTPLMIPKYRRFKNNQNYVNPKTAAEIIEGKEQ